MSGRASSSRTPSDTEALGLSYQTSRWNVAIFDKRVGRTWNDNGSVNQASANQPFNLTNLFVNYTLGAGTRFDRR